MPVVRMVVAYEGTRYAGWQRQKNAMTVQAALEDALRTITGRHVAVAGAGRTDTGVHAWGQVAHADVPGRLDPATLQRALNACLPDDILVRDITRIRGRFHARFDARRKRYRYRIVTGPLRPLFDRSLVQYVPGSLQVTAMRRAARHWVGPHDFGRFHSTGRAVAITRRTVTALTIRRHGLEITIEVTADGFLYHMVRRMVGVLLKVGKGRWAPEIAARFIRPGQPAPDAPTAPARGLMLMEVAYGSR